MRKAMHDRVDEFREILKTINKREDGIFDFDFFYDDELKMPVLVDSCEEFYYDGYAFDRIYDELNDMVKKLFGKDYYLDCECPGRWVIGE